MIACSLRLIMKELKVNILEENLKRFYNLIICF